MAHEVRDMNKAQQAPRNNEMQLEYLLLEDHYRDPQRETRSMKISEFSKTHSGNTQSVFPQGIERRSLEYLSNSSVWTCSGSRDNKVL